MYELSWDRHACPVQAHKTEPIAPIYIALLAQLLTPFTTSGILCLFYSEQLLKVFNLELCSFTLSLTIVIWQCLIYLLYSWTCTPGPQLVLPTASSPVCPFQLMKRSLKLCTFNIQTTPGFFFFFCQWFWQLYKQRNVPQIIHIYVQTNMTKTWQHWCLWTRWCFTVPDKVLAICSEVLSRKIKRAFRLQGDRKVIFRSNLQSSS